MTIAVVKPGFLTTFQDAGRAGLAHLGVGRAGAFDEPALRIANALCGNPGNAAALEITLRGPTLHFHAQTWIAVTGAPIPVNIDDTDQPMWAPLAVPAGARIALGAVRSGCRSYLAVRGGFDVAPVLGSRSTDVNARLGPFNGRALQSGDELPTPRSEPAKLDRTAPPWRVDPRPWFAGAGQERLRLMPGTHVDRLVKTSNKLLFSRDFHVHPDSNRVGLRLTGPRLEWETPGEMVSEGCVPGLLQLPPSGQPIAFGPECPVSGGYPRIGQIAAVDMPRLAQLRPGDALRFSPCTFEDALRMLRERERALATLENTIRHRLNGTLES